MRRMLSGVLICVALNATASTQKPADSSASEDSAYEIQQDVLIKARDGATLSAIVVRKRSGAERLPTLLMFDIYADPAAAVTYGQDVAARGYVGVTAYTRGKHLSPGPVVPYEREVDDTHAVLDWIVRQPWSNGDVGMSGGSYSGFTAWAATKRKHPALKTIAVSAAAIPGIGLPMYHNVFLNANYGWTFYTTNNRYLDNEIYGDQQRWWQLSRDWFASGRPYREIDRIDGTPNPWLQRWLQHPEYDEYWQRMVPYDQDFASIDIPVLTMTGYYDDGQISALHYLKEHAAHRANAEHYAVIGPYDHLGSHARVKETVLRGYSIDPVAQISTPELVSQWMDHVLRGGPRPALLKDKINFQVMGANEWRHAPSLEAMSPKRTRLYFSDTTAAEERFELTTTMPAKPGRLVHTVDLANRNIFHNFNFYPFPIVGAKLQYITELQFITEPFDAPTVLSGALSGELSVSLNKKDFDFGITAFELMPDGTLFNLGYTLARASFAKDASHRELLTPGQTTRLPFETTVVSRRISSGSRLLLLFDAVKNPNAQVNYGTGKDVSDESVGDAGEPLRIELQTASYIDLPLDRVWPAP